MILRLRADLAGLDALPFEATKASHIMSAIAEWQRTGHLFPVPIDIWDACDAKWIRVPHHKNGAAFLLITGRLPQAGEIWAHLERQEDYFAELHQMIGTAIGSLFPERQRPALVWSAPDD